jgi:hypothetical protein
VGETVHKTRGHGIAHTHKDNGDGRCGGLGGASCLVLEGDNQIDALPHKRLGGGIGGGLIGQVAPVEDEVFPLLVAQGFELFPQDVQGRWDVIEAHVEEPNPPDLPGLLRLGPARRHEQAEDKGRDETTRVAVHSRLLRSASYMP